MMFQLQLARELHMPLSKMREEMTVEEIGLWGVFFQVESEENKKQQKKMAARRR